MLWEIRPQNAASEELGWSVHRTLDGTYWNAQARAGLLLSLCITVVTIAYFLATWDTGENRPVLVGVSFGVLAACVATAVAVPAPRVGQSARWAALFYVWCLGASALIFAGTALDGGLDSPLAWLFVVNVAMTGLVHPPRLVALATVLSSAGLLGAALVDDAPFDGPTVLPRLVYLVSIGYLAVVTAGARWRRHDEQVTLTNALADLVERDPMTRLLNHSAFHARLGEELARAERYGLPVSLLVADLDNFKSVNDDHGHRTGDAALERVANLLRAMARRSDVAARIGGEEFCLLLPDTDHAAAVAVAERLRRSVASLTDPVQVTVSIGVSTFPGCAPTADKLFEHADRSLYEAKRAGRNRVGHAGSP